MEIEGLFTRGKWELIELISEKERSPMQLAEILQTSVANVSQQLKLLELIDLVTTRKIPNRERGKPRTLYSISHDHIFVISALKNFAKKSFIKASPMHAAVSRILCYPDQEMHYALMKLFWILEPQKEITAMVFDTSSSTLQVATPKPSGLKLQSSYSINNQTIHVKVVAGFKALKESQYTIYDPNHLLEKEVKA